MICSGFILICRAGQSNVSVVFVKSYLYLYKYIYIAVHDRHRLNVHQEKKQKNIRKDHT